MKHILIDFENIQPKPDQLQYFYCEDCHIWLFLGKQQQKLSPELCKVLCCFGRHVKHIHLVHVAKTGKNALDFYLAFHLGRIAEQDKNAEIVILSRDGGYDVLVEHMQDNRLCIGIERLEDLKNKQPQILLLPKPKHIPQVDGQFLWACCKKVVQVLAEESKIKLRFRQRNNLIRHIYQTVLNKELNGLDLSGKESTAADIVDKLVKQGFIKSEHNDWFGYGSFTDDALLEILVGHIKSARAKKLIALKNVVRIKAQQYYHDLTDKDIDLLLDHCEKENILKRVGGEMIHYLPEVGPQTATVSVEKDDEIIQKISILLEKLNRPTTKTALINMLKSTFKELDCRQVEQFIHKLTEQKKLAFGSNEKIIYPSAAIS